MQITEIVLYSRSGQKRILPFKLGKASIITGESTTGKSALIDIVDYCLGSSNCNIPEGKIRETVAWFGLLIQFPSGQVFIARENPPHNRSTTNRAYLIQGDALVSPDSALLEPNTTIDAVIEFLNNKIGISPNLHVPAQGQTRKPLEANIRHGLLLCFQQQDEIASKRILFHRQEDSFVSQAIKDTLPYFLGAIKEDRLALEQELVRAQRELKVAERALREAELIKGEGVSKAIGLLTEARQVGLLPQGETPLELQDFYNLFQKVIQWTPEQVAYPGTDDLTQLQEEVKNLQIELNEKSDVIHAAKVFAQEAEGYASEVKQQELRLESIGLFESDCNNPDICPICNQRMEIPVPSVTAIRNALDKVKSNLEITYRERPRLREYIENLEKEREGIIYNIRKKNEAIEGILKEKDAAIKLKDLNARRGRVVGRISLWLESIDLTDNLSELRKKVNDIQDQVRALERELDLEEKEERLTSILNRIGIQMTEWARRLNLEHSENPIRLDIKRATVVADREDRPIPLKNMGSGENWVGYHIVSYLALHQIFCRYSRPVPRFIFFDQPSQVYYPSDNITKKTGSLNNLNDKDRQSIIKMFHLILDVVESLAPELQVIITDHADLVDERFESAVIERWRNGNALVPSNWS
ncbi:MAG: DUF3732 domain-containing protein [Bacillus sp. (in: Bacteria)]|nr:DUF3732 domain-containing protein [Bacillus sp. (in: firmicutes)]